MSPIWSGPRLSGEYAPPDEAGPLLTWDTHIAIENLSKQVLRNYLQLFACYHTPGTNYYRGRDGAILPCSPGGFNAVAGSEQQARLEASPWRAHAERYRGPHEIEFFRYGQPALLSERRPWFNGARHVILVQPDTCAAIVTWRNQARDYMVRPRDYDLGPGESFTARVRHIIAPVESEEGLAELWERFEEDLGTERG